ncbi:hypothetical protein SCP_1501700 [Sparassis crispa]|uniref:DUF1446-domain-containing protein n=1 Tax=Sparassis crispa TaxID=139825 RepID=A0A401H435_9APHY|nr:hypothetical protein SCP_1501700 [Sparassis crispa]GBE89163.1 hypothetical protein SCP_1501700 [Sparassis crispa]
MGLGSSQSRPLQVVTVMATITATAPDQHEIRIITPIGMLGYGYNASEFLDACEKRRPHAIICDSGSTDSGPQKLALGVTTCPREAYVRDLGPLLLACAKFRIAILIGSCGGSGTNAQVDLFADIVRELADTHGYSFRVAKIYAEFDKDVVKASIGRGRVHPCGPVPALTAEDVDATPVIVGQMGAEPFLDVLNADESVDIILGGRAYDPAPYAALCFKHGIEPGIAWHMVGIIFTTIRHSSFDVEPTAPSARCTCISVAAHTLYEKTRPDLLPGPGGVLNLQGTTYEQLDERVVRVRGAVFEPKRYQVKLEGARITGFRTVFIGGIRDAVLISQIDRVLDVVETYARSMNPTFKGEDCRIAFHVYGKNGVMGPLEPVKTPAHELCILGEVLAPTQKLAHGVCNALRVALLHAPYPYQIATAGNMGSPLTPLETDIGEASEFSIYHLLDIDDPHGPFPISYETVGSPGAEPRYPSYPAAAPGTGAATEKAKAEAGKRMQALIREMETLRVNPAGNWQNAIKNGEKSVKLRDIATVLRSKNSGPYELTFDVMFPSDEIFNAVQDSNELTKEVLARAYGVEPEAVIACLFFKQARAFKFTIPRVHSNGSFGETDMHGCQQHIPLGDIDVPLLVRRG